ncbi:hypothetical protein VTO42DRAFT_5896 [Malbranchea cinnamomea]
MRRIELIKAVRTTCYLMPCIVFVETASPARCDIYLLLGFCRRRTFDPPWLITYHRKCRSSLYGINTSARNAMDGLNAPKQSLRRSISGLTCITSATTYKYGGAGTRCKPPGYWKKELSERLHIIAHHLYFLSTKSSHRENTQSRVPMLVCMY